MESTFFKTRNKKQTVRRIISYLMQSKWKLFFVGIIAIVADIISLSGTFMLKFLIDNVIEPVNGEPDMLLLLIIISIMMACYIFAFIISLLQIKMMAHISQKTIERMRNDLFTKLEKLPITYFDRSSHGDIMSRFTNDMDLVSEMLNTTLLQLYISVLLIFLISIFMLVLNWLLALIAFAFIPVIIFVAKYYMYKAKSHFAAVQETTGLANGYIEEHLQGQKIIKVFSHEQETIEEFEKINSKLFYHQQRSQFNSTLTIPTINALSNVTYIVCTVIGALLSFTIFQEFITIGVLGTFIAFVRQFSRPFNIITNQLNILQAAIAGADRMFVVIDEEEEIAKDDSCYRSKKTDEGYYWTANDIDVKVKGDVQFNNVIFGYDKNKIILDDISLYAKPGQKIAFVGSTGAGKTTITNLLTRFYEINSGSITIDGIDISKIKRSTLRKSMTMVLQDTHLFTGTIMENIRYGRLRATDEECIAASELACAHSFIVKLKDGYNTLISGTGESLSEGQKQLLSIARSAVANPPILILDEATSSIDTRTEKYIEQGMNELMKNKTTFVIAHRLSTVRNANAIIVLEHGKIVERGNHEDLLKLKGRYYQLYAGIAELE